MAGKIQEEKNYIFDCRPLSWVSNSPEGKDKHCVNCSGFGFPKTTNCIIHRHKHNLFTVKQKIFCFF